MSIYDEIAHRVSEKRLFALAPALPNVTTARRIYISPEISSLLFGPWDEPEWEERCGYLRADFDRFLEGRLITAAARPYKAKTAYIAQLDAPRDEVWEIRSRDPDPGLRVFGRFADTDVFIALTWSKRADLKGPTSREWRDAIEGCKAEWRKLFPAYSPISGVNIHDYISANVVLV